MQRLLRSTVSSFAIALVAAACNKDRTRDATKTGEAAD